MRISMLDPGSFTPLYDGNLCHALAKRGHEVDLSAPEFLFESVQPLGGYDVNTEFFRAVHRSAVLRRYRLPRQVLKASCYPLEIAQWASQVKRGRPDVVHVQWSLLPLLDATVLERLRRAGIPVVLTAHDVGRLSRSIWPMPGLRALYRVPDAIVVHADAARRHLVDLGVHAERVHVVPMGGPGAYAPDPVPREQARELLALDPSAPYLLFLGMIKPYKGLDVLLEAVALALRTRPDVRLLVAGQPFGSWRRYARQIARLGIGSNVDVRLGFVPNDRTQVYFGAAEVVVLPYRAIWQSGMAMAAYTYGRPVIATNVGGLAELVHEGETGCLVPRGDPDALARAILDALSDPARLARMGAAASALARGPHSWDEIAARHEHIYTDALEQTRGLPTAARTDTAG